MRALDAEAKTAEIVVLHEVGIDPSNDHGGKVCTAASRCQCFRQLGGPWLARAWRGARACSGPSARLKRAACAEEAIAERATVPGESGRGRMMLISSCC